MTKFFYSNHVNGDESSYVVAEAVWFDGGLAVFSNESVNKDVAAEPRNIVLALAPGAWKSIWKEDGDE